jgi:hypothetical protein
MNKRIDQYIAEYEELDLDENDHNTNNELIKKMKVLMIEFSSSFSFFEKNNAETFIIIFESMKNSQSMIIVFINRSFSHYFIDFYIDMNDQSSQNDQIIDHFQISLKTEFSYTDMKNINSDSFAYVMTFDRYISEKFCEMMIDSSASTKSTAEYDQYC